MLRCVLFLACLFITSLAGAVRDERIKVSIEEPANGASYSGISNLRGWAVSPEGVGQSLLEVFIDGDFAFYLSPYGERIDVGNAFPDYPDSDTGGFSMAYNYKNLAPGEHEVKVVVYDNAGNHNSAISVFRTERFNSSFIAQDAEIDLSTTDNIYLYDDQTYLVSGATLEGEKWDFILSWDRASQSFKTEGILPAATSSYPNSQTSGGSSSGGASGSGNWSVYAGADDGNAASNTCSQSTLVTNATLSISDSQVIEGDEGSTDMTFDVSLSRAASSNVCVEYRTSDNTANAGEDYVAASGALTFAAGETSKSVTVSVIGDNLYADEDGDESFTVSLISSSANVADGDAVGTITNDDMTIEESLDDLKALLRPFYTDLREQDRHLREFPIDLGGDGDEDLIVQVHSIVENEVLGWLVEAYPLSYFVNNKGNGFERVDTDIELHSSLWETADVNGDGLDDLISVADHQIHEVDGQIYREDYVRLLVQTENGELIDSSDSVDELYADWHGLTVLDIELDGDIDFVAGGLHDSVYAFINDGFGNFSITQNNLPIAELNAFMATGGFPTPSDQSLFFTNIHAVDLNNDGYKEILLGGANSPNHYLLTAPLMPILRNENGTFTFDYVTDTLDILIPALEGPSVPAVVGMEDIDINGDGCTDLMFHQTDYHENSAVTTYESDCNGSLSEVFHYQFSKPGWTAKFFIADVTADGIDDFYGQYNADQLALFTNNNDATYTHSEVDEFTHPSFDLATYISIMLWKSVPHVLVITNVDPGDRGLSLDVTANNGGSEITSYDATCTDGTSIYTGTSPSSPITVSGLTNGVAYTCTVTATNSVGTSLASAATDPVTPVAPTGPSAPSITKTDYGDGELYLFVTASNGGADITRYDASCTDGTNTYTGTSATSPITVSGLTNDVAYTCTVTATNSVGTSSASAATAPITPEEQVGGGLPIWLLYQATQ